MKYCTCECPRPHPNPRYKGCLCGKAFDPDWLSTPETVRAWFDRLEAGIFPGKPDPHWLNFRDQCEARERDGHDRYGLDYFERDNLREAAEEEADAVLYRFLRKLQRYRESGDEEALSLLLEASKHSYMAYRLDREAEAKLLGSP